MPRSLPLIALLCGILAQASSAQEEDTRVFGSWSASIKRDMMTDSITLQFVSTESSDGTIRLGLECTNNRVSYASIHVGRAFGDSSSTLRFRFDTAAPYIATGWSWHGMTEDQLRRITDEQASSDSRIRQLGDYAETLAKLSARFTATSSAAGLLGKAALVRKSLAIAISPAPQDTDGPIQARLSLIGLGAALRYIRCRP